MPLKSFSELNLKNAIDVLYFYRNMRHYLKKAGGDELVDELVDNRIDKRTDNRIDKRTDNNSVSPNTFILEKLKSVSVHDSVIGSYCLNFITEYILEEINEREYDEEIVEVYKKSVREYNRKERTIEGTIDNSRDNGRDKGTIDNSTIDNSGDTSDVLCLDCLNILILPFIFYNDKQILDIVTFVYKKKNIDLFGVLFESYRDKHDLLVELHLLKAKLLQQGKKGTNGIEKDKGGTDNTDGTDSADSTYVNSSSSSRLCVAELKEAIQDKLPQAKSSMEKLNEKITEPEESDDNSSGRDFFPYNSTQSLDDINSNINNSNSTSNINNSASNNNNMNSTENSVQFHLDLAKSLLLEYSSESKFFIMNATRYLLLSYDRQILMRLLSFSTTPYFFPFTIDLTFPWYFYKYMYINSMIYYNIKYNPYTLKYYIEHYLTVESNTFSNNISKGLILKKMGYMIRESVKVMEGTSGMDTEIGGTGGMEGTSKINSTTGINNNQSYSVIWREMFIRLNQSEIILFNEVIDQLDTFVDLLEEDEDSEEVASNTETQSSDSSSSEDSNSHIISSVNTGVRFITVPVRLRVASEGVEYTKHQRNLSELEEFIENNTEEVFDEFEREYLKNNRELYKLARDTSIGIKSSLSASINSSSGIGINNSSGNGINSSSGIGINSSSGNGTNDVFGLVKGILDSAMDLFPSHSNLPLYKSTLIKYIHKSISNNKTKRRTIEKILQSKIKNYLARVEKTEIKEKILKIEKGEIRYKKYIEEKKEEIEKYFE